MLPGCAAPSGFWREVDGGAAGRQTLKHFPETLLFALGFDASVKALTHVNLLPIPVRCRCRQLKRAAQTSTKSTVNAAVSA